ncbi:DUF4329 domain-containing protein [Seohaeicola nanhaiensis]|uniref:DUF4329 domain-containing protein n=1 Tax=Seohaeicola nanhaiensis TaxID=1387282 RepID=A0ABV9KI38_9RHOB
MIILLFLATALVLGRSPAPPRPPPADEVALVIRKLGPLQTMSFATDREFCGYLLEGRGGVLFFTKMTRGGRDGCTPRMPDSGPRVVASVHTHGSYDPQVPAEFPTTLDLESDRREGVAGYVATPGGRLWYIDSVRMVTYQLCGTGCLPQDPDFHDGDDGVIAIRYSHRQLLALEGGAP